MNVRDPRRGALRITHEEENNGIKAEKLMTVHKNTQGAEELFSFTDESDGSLRLLDLKPAFDKLNSSNGSLTYVIDELDRSLHTKLTSHLIARYLEECNEDSRKQLIFTTHDVQLIDQELFRRDELWICERAEDGSSEMYPVTDFKDLRVDKDIQKSYLQGIMGGLPRLLASGAEHNENFLEPVYPETISCSLISFTNLREVEETPCQTPIKFSLSETQPC
nr:AAA family ATPase [Turicimonas muris]